MGIAAALSAASTGLSVFGSVMGGNAKAKGAEYQADHTERASQYGQIKAAQTSTYMNRDLADTLGNIPVVTDSGNVAGDSPTGAAIEANSRAVGTEQINNRVNNIVAQSQDRDGPCIAGYGRPFLCASRS